MRFAGKVAIVTGGSAGLGAAIALRLGQEGAAVVIADIVGATEAAVALSDAGITSLGVETDVASWASVQAMVAATTQRFGHIDILINNAAIASTLSLKPFYELTTEEFQNVLAVNTIGTFHGCKAVAALMRQQNSGRIINMASGTAIRGAPFIAHYVASKGAVMSLTRSLARELGKHNILVNAVSPGYTLTDTNLANEEYLAATRQAVRDLRCVPRDAYPDDIVGAVAFLASDDAKFITGQILAVDGGAVYH
jgi:NAD(P)-dependent dehydrogenase (short-subunit alcohol dehydrogenase family)